jgi:lipoprotein LenA
MRKALVLGLALCVMLPFCCKKADQPARQDEGQDEILGKKYAKYRVQVMKGSDLKGFLAVLEKGEMVALIGEEKITTPQGKTLDVARVKLADDAEGYLETRHLADRVIVFVDNVKAFVRPTSGSAVHLTIPKGTIGFVVGEKANWVQVYAGKIEGKYLSGQWVESGYVDDPQILVDARTYESAMDAMKSGGEDRKAEARKKLEEVARGTNLISEMARNAIAQPAQEGAPEHSQPAEQQVEQK